MKDIQLHLDPAKLGGIEKDRDQLMQNSTEMKIRIEQLAMAIIRDETDTVFAARFIVDHRFQLETLGDEDECFDFFIAFVSETEEIPDDHNRERYSETYLRKSDEEKQRYTSLMSNKLKDACRSLLERLHNKSEEK